MSAFEMSRYDIPSPGNPGADFSDKLNPLFLNEQVHQILPPTLVGRQTRESLRHEENRQEPRFAEVQGMFGLENVLSDA